MTVALAISNLIDLKDGKLTKNLILTEDMVRLKA